MWYYGQWLQNQRIEKMQIFREWFAGTSQYNKLVHSPSYQVILPYCSPLQLVENCMYSEQQI